MVRPLLVVSSSHRQCTVSVLIVAELGKGVGRAEILSQNNVDIESVWLRIMLFLDCL